MEELTDFLRFCLPEANRRPSGLVLTSSGVNRVSVSCRDRGAFVKLMESRPFILWPNKHLDCVVDDSATHSQFFPLTIRRADDLPICPSDLAALESTLEMVLGDLLTVQLEGGWDRKAKATAWFFLRQTREDALLMGGIMCSDVFFDFLPVDDQ